MIFWPKALFFLLPGNHRRIEFKFFIFDLTPVRVFFLIIVKNFREVNVGFNLDSVILLLSRLIGLDEVFGECYLKTVGIFIRGNQDDGKKPISGI